MAQFSTKFLAKSVALAAGLMVVGGAALGADVAAYAGKSIALKDVRGTVYYAPHGDAFDVVVTLDSDGHPMRVVSSLQPGQKTVLSVPGALGEAATTVESSARAITWSSPTPRASSAPTSPPPSRAPVATIDRTDRAGNMKGRPCPTGRPFILAVRPAIPQGVDQQGEGGRRLPPARIIEVIARKRRAPVVECADQPSFPICPRTRSSGR